MENKRFLWQADSIKNENKFLEDTWACNDNQCYKDLHLSFSWIDQENQNLEYKYNERPISLNTKDFEREKFNFNNCKLDKRDETLDVSIVERTLSPVYLENEKTPLYYGYNTEDSILLATNNEGKELTGKQWLKDNKGKSNNSVTNLLPSLYKYRTQSNSKVSQQSNYNKEITEATKSIGDNLDRIQSKTQDNSNLRLKKNYKSYTDRLTKLKNEIKEIGDEDLKLFLSKIEELKKKNNINDEEYKKYITKLEDLKKYLEEDDLKTYIQRLKELENNLQKNNK